MGRSILKMLRREQRAIQDSGFCQIVNAATSVPPDRQTPTQVRTRRLFAVITGISFCIIASQSRRHSKISPLNSASLSNKFQDQRSLLNNYRIGDRKADQRQHRGYETKVSKN